MLRRGPSRNVLASRKLRCERRNAIAKPKKQRAGEDHRGTEIKSRRCASSPFADCAGGENDVELPVLYSEHRTGDGQKMFEHAAKLNWEGIISKRADAPYRSDRTEAWLKIKTVQKAKFPVV